MGCFLLGFFLFFLFGQTAISDIAYGQNILVLHAQNHPIPAEVLEVIKNYPFEEKQVTSSTILNLRPYHKIITLDGLSFYVVQKHFCNNQIFYYGVFFPEYFHLPEKYVCGIEIIDLKSAIKVLKSHFPRRKIVVIYTKVSWQKIASVKKDKKVILWKADTDKKVLEVSRLFCNHKSSFVFLFLPDIVALRKTGVSCLLAIASKHHIQTCTIGTNTNLPFNCYLKIDKKHVQEMLKRFLANKPIVPSTKYILEAKPND